MSLKYLHTRRALIDSLRGGRLCWADWDNYTAFPIAAVEFRLFGELILDQTSPVDALRLARLERQ